MAFLFLVITAALEIWARSRFQELESAAWSRNSRSLPSPTGLSRWRWVAEGNRQKPPRHRNFLFRRLNRRNSASRSSYIYERGSQFLLSQRNLVAG
jgi:hypothetical protein